MLKPSFTYRATLVKVIDADTIDVVVDLGLRITTKIRLRLFGINAPERNTYAGKVAKLALIQLIPASSKLNILTFKDPVDKYGRWLAEVEIESGISVNRWLVANGHAVEAQT